MWAYEAVNPDLALLPLAPDARHGLLVVGGVPVRVEPVRWDTNLGRALPGNGLPGIHAESSSGTVFGTHKSTASAGMLMTYIVTDPPDIRIEVRWSGSNSNHKRGSPPRALDEARQFGERAERSSGVP